MTLTDILNKFREMASNTSQQGEMFEKFMRYVFLNAPVYKGIIDKVWRWKDFPYNGSVHDIGIDLVAKTLDGDYWAIQCKFYDFDSVISKAQIDSFLSASATQFTDSSGENRAYKDRIVVATCGVGENAQTTMAAQTTPAHFLHVLEALDNCGIDWTDFWKQFTSNQTVKAEWKRRELRDHQKTALDDVVKGFRQFDRGKLVMACGTGKTLTSLRITEKIVPHGGLALYLVPSLSLLGQTLSAWTLDANKPIRPILVCSDTTINNKESRKRVGGDDAINELVSDMALPATTKAKEIVDRYDAVAGTKKGITVVFSTYQSLQAVVDAQKKGLPEFDLVVCDEAHRTTGFVSDADLSNATAFTLVHDNRKVKAKKRLYMTATPKIYGTGVKNKLSKMKNEGDGCGVLFSMDDESVYGPEFHKLSFEDAVKQDLLSDYKVIVLTVTHQNIKRFSEFENLGDVSVEQYRELYPKQLRNIEDEEVKELQLNALAQLFGCWQGLAKQGKYIGDDKQLTDDFAADPLPMHRAVAFAPSIRVSRDFIRPRFESISNANLIMQQRQRQEDPNFNEPTLRLEVEHIDGSIVANKRAEKLKWLEEDAGNETCRILTNVRCLSEGVDVLALDAVIFLSPKNSKVDIIQSVGRVMRKAEGKKYGYIILPIAVPESADPKTILDDNERFQVVWDVLQALRSHDERLRIEINKIKFNELPAGFDPATADLTAMGGGGADDEIQISGSVQSTILFPNVDDDFKTRIKAKIVKNCGDRYYLEESAKTVATIAKGHIDEIKKQLLHPTPAQQKAFDAFIEKLQNDINPAIDREQAIEMISQHLVIQPVFDALFKDYQFARKNVVSQAFEQFLDVFHKTNSDEENEKLRKVREDIENRVAGITTLHGKQRVIITLYDQFFKNASPKTAEKLGIVYTPVEVVDFIIHSVEHILQQEFGKSMSNKNVHILDPFTGTGTFIVQLLQSGIIKPDGPNFAYKFNNELHANEIVLLAYYIAAINIEEAFHILGKREKYTPFPGLVLTDTFQMFEKELPEKANMPINVLGDDNAEEVENNERIIRQRRSNIQVILGNPPYSIGQTSANDNNQNQGYPNLDKRVEETYAAESTANLKRGIYDAYIKAFRWASDRIGNKGVIGFITNNGWIEKGSMDGFRKCLTEEFTSVYVYNLRGAVRGRSGDDAKKEGGNVFDIMTGVAIVLLVKNPNKSGCQIFYHDIGEYLSRSEKKKIIKKHRDISQLTFQNVTPNQYGDWINQRGEDFQKYYIIGDKKGEEKELPSFFGQIYSLGVATNRDAWSYNYSEKELANNMKRMISFYNQQVQAYGRYVANHSDPAIEDFMSSDSQNTDPTKISWSSGLTNNLQKQNIAKTFDKKFIRTALYRPFCKMNLYYGDKVIERPGQFSKLFPTSNADNFVICVNGLGSRKDFSCIISNSILDLNVLEAGTQCFPLYYYTPGGEEESSLFGSGKGKVVDGLFRRDAVTDEILDRARKQYKVNGITKQDLFYYVYGFLHSPKYRKQYAADLKKSLARIPLVKSFSHFKEFADAGEKLAELHLNYDSPARLKAALTRINKSVRTPFLPVKVNCIVDRSLWDNDKDVFYVEKMRFGKKNKQDDRSVIVYNECVMIKDVPLDAYEYVVNGKSAIEWVMERYQVKTDSASQIENNPNLWEDGENPKFIVELLESVITVSVNTMKIVNALPQDWEA